MAQKNETSILVLALLITLGLIGGVYWWLASSFDINLGSISNNQSQSKKNQPNLPSGEESFKSVKRGSFWII